MVTQSDTKKTGRPQASPARMGLIPDLIVGIKRRVQRHSDTKAQEAEAQFRAARKPAMAAANYTCIHCGFRSENLNEVYHVDNNHANNDPKNLKCVCNLCHPYHHVGEPSKSKQAKGLEEGHLGNSTRLIRVPAASAVSPQDMNHLMRVLGIALSDEKEAPRAREIHRLLANASLLREMREHYASDEPKVMAAAMQQLTDDEYNARLEAVKDLRIVYRESYLQQLGRGLKKEQPAFANPEAWESLLERPLELVKQQAHSHGAAAGPGVGIDALMDDENDDENDDEEGDDE